jgi:hypothetical protein
VTGVQDQQGSGEKPRKRIENVVVGTDKDDEASSADEKDQRRPHDDDPTRAVIREEIGPLWLLSQWCWFLSGIACSFLYHIGLQSFFLVGWLK